MKILFTTATYLPSVNGVAIAVAELKKELEKRGHTVVIMAPDNPKALSKESGILRYPSLANPLIPDYPIPLFPGLNSIFKLAKYKKFDIVHTHHPFSVGYFAQLLAAQYKVPLVFSYHTRYDFYVEQYFKTAPRFLKNILVKKSVADFCRKSDLVIAPSVFVAGRLLGKLKLTNLATIPTGLPEITIPELNRETLRKKLHLPQNRKILLTITRLAREKNSSFLLKTMSRLKNGYLLLIIGSGPDEKKLRDQAKRLRLSGKVRFLGVIDHNELGKFYKAADLFVYPSVSETQGLVFLEALSFGLPVAAIDSPIAREWVKDDFGVLASKNPLEFAYKISDLLETNYQKMAIPAREFASGFSIEKTTGLLLEEYRKIINLKFKYRSNYSKKRGDENDEY